MTRSLTEADYQALQRAFKALENPSFAARLNSIVGTPIELGINLLPERWRRRLHRAAEHCVDSALGLVLQQGTRPVARRLPGDRGHRWLGMAAGAAGGFFGGPALLMELPLTTAVMLSSIADIARREGEDMTSLETRLACLEVFALGGRSDLDDAADTGYYGLRLALEVPVAEASRYLAQVGQAGLGKPPALVQLVQTLAQRFGLILSEKTAAQLVPLVGAAGGAMINRLFIEHFQTMAHGHFTLRRLERTYSPAVVQAHYARLKRRQKSLPTLPAD